ncbi:MAG TPA: hypothetical protein VN844_23150 [Pyrinomonadaceae bacterium]|nr:hypothetical protein [Pyrinomonadaceae bacterium]
MQHALLLSFFFSTCALILSGAHVAAAWQQKLTPAEEALVQGSKEAILATGISETYFQTHFKLLKVVDKSADRRVTWQFSINEHSTVINDAIGYYTQGTNRIDTHSIAKALGQTTEIQRTLTRSRALSILKSCIGSFDNPSVLYGPVNGQAQLVMVAYKRARVESKSEREEEREREREKREKQKAIAAGTDLIESEEDEGKDKAPPLIMGAVNLQTGKCTKGAGLITPLL